MEIFALRPHHALCTTFYTGHGYSKSFNENMKHILAACKNGASIRIVSGMDDVCASCPNNHDSCCTSEEKVRRYDDAVLNLCHWQPGQEMSWQVFRSRTKEAILSPGLRETVCSDCEWNDLCCNTPPQY